MIGNESDKYNVLSLRSAIIEQKIPDLVVPPTGSENPNVLSASPATRPAPAGLIRDATQTPTRAP
jgi:hypothetical protein